MNAPSFSYQDWEMRQLPEDKILEEVKQSVQDETQIAEVIKGFKKYKADKKQMKGFIYTGFGSFVCFVSTVVTLWNPSPELTNFFLYWMTSIGIIITFIGLYWIFED
jgi:hypothetical protein